MKASPEKMAELKRPLTYEDYLTFPDDGRRYEIIEGELFMTPAPATKHQQISLHLEMALYPHLRKNKLGSLFHAPCDVVFSETNVVQPDIFFVSTERSSIITEKNIQGAPDLIIEITSPATEAVDRGEKKRLYERYGVREYWIVDPEREEVEVWVLRAGHFQLQARHGREETLTSPLLPGFQLPLQRVFGD